MIHIGDKRVMLYQIGGMILRRQHDRTISSNNDLNYIWSQE
jgi:hypothetical protein